MTASRGRSAAELTMKNIGENVVRIEADALRALADRLAGPMAADFERAVEMLYNCAGRVIVTGMGKSGLIARKIAATLTSTGSPCTVPASCGGAARRSRNGGPRRCRCSPSRPAEKPAKSFNYWLP